MSARSASDGGSTTGGLDEEDLRNMAEYESEWEAQQRQDEEDERYLAELEAAGYGPADEDDVRRNGRAFAAHRRRGNRRSDATLLSSPSCRAPWPLPRAGCRWRWC